METIGKIRKSLASIILGAGLVLALTEGTLTTGATTQSGEVVAAPDNPAVTGTPRPIRLRPWVQFGHAQPGDTADYRKLLFNHLDEQTE